MIYRIEFNENYNLPEIMDKMKSLGKFCISNRMFYLETSIDSFDFGVSKVEIQEINESNIDKVPKGMVYEWCNKILLDKRIAEFENSKDGQIKLKEMSDLIDKIEREVVSVGGKENAESKFPRSRSSKTNKNQTGK